MRVPSTRSRRHQAQPVIDAAYSGRSYVERETGQQRRLSGIAKRASCHTWRNFFVAPVLEYGTDIRTLQELLGSQGRGDDNDLHARPEPGAGRGTESGRPVT